MSDGSVDPTPEQIQALMGDSEEEMTAPIAMVNLLRFRERADYPADFEAEPCSGAEAYQRYAGDAVAAVGRVGGSPIWGAEARQIVIGPEQEDWDQAFIVLYPSRNAFLQMIQDPDYQAIVPHRTAALADSRLILCDHNEQAPEQPDAPPAA